ncbi:fungal cellulose binding domain-containing protein [Colletotrichum truncatum]|uniref:Fungal cellulose binding domain-containing protein n=1 Tax=Colletotrichum truncatum TaxID=5467 RepID=A0ACC3YH15_COLTU|nr:fungal cellulose binding domain-containing protein [Colletotrichum truncatum]KAF6792718.1 fungal cellulose binding domain-containing protein [Colletotrichum truncatum]
MKTTVVLSAVLGLLSSASAHYTFDKLLVNGAQKGGDNTYIRKHQNGYMPTKFKNIPSGSISPNDADFTCNKQATGAPMVMTVKAGDKIGLKQAFGGTGMLHPGPSQVYMSPVSNAKTDKGSNWYKVHQSLLCKSGNPELLRSGAWCSYGEDNVWFTVPSTIPNGQYLVRGEHIGLHGAHDGQAEFYYACAQVEVTGNSATSMPGTATKIPGVYKQSDAPVNFSLWGSATSYPKAPGPDVIPGGTIRGSANGSGGDKTATVGGGSSSSKATSGNGGASSAPACNKN